MWGYGPFGGYGTGFGVFGLLFMVVFWALIIVGTIALIRYIASPSREDRKHYHRTPLEILQERFAKGEIDKKEYEEKKKDLS